MWTTIGIDAWKEEPFHHIKSLYILIAKIMYSILQ